VEPVVWLLCCYCAAAVLPLCCCADALLQLWLPLLLLLLLCCCCCAAAVLLLCCCCAAALLLLCCCCAPAPPMWCCGLWCRGLFLGCLMLVLDSLQFRLFSYVIVDAIGCTSLIFNTCLLTLNVISMQLIGFIEIDWYSIHVQYKPVVFVDFQLFAVQSIDIH